MEPPQRKRKRDSDQSLSHVCIVHVDRLNYGEQNLFSESKGPAKKTGKIAKCKKYNALHNPYNPVKG